MSLGRVAGVGCHGFGLRNPLRLASEHEIKTIRGTPFRIPSTVPFNHERDFTSGLCGGRKA